MDKDVQAAFENFDMSSIKKAGPIFDGFCIWLTGLEGVYRERAAAIVSRAGGVRYDCPHERVTHVVAGTRAAAAAAGAATDAPVLMPAWLLRSVEAGRALDEAEFIVKMDPSTPLKSSGRKPCVEPESPLSKRNLQLLRRPLDLPPPPQPEPPPPPQDDIVNHYLSQNIPEPFKEKTPEPEAQPDQPDVTEDVCEDPTEEIEQIFRDVKIEVQGLDEAAICELGAEVSAAGGALAAAGAGGAYVLAPLDFDPDERITPDAEPVTVFWVKDCLSQQELLPIQYYHRPVKIPVWGGGPGPLHGVVASLSTYTGCERAFLDEVAQLLGATTQLRFCRRNTANALASTHLICPTPTGDKYLGAVKWGLPAVEAAWLLECVAQGKRVSEKPYLVGETKAPKTPEPEAMEQVQEPLEAEAEPKDCEQAATDKENAMLPPAGAAVPRRGSVPSREHTPQAKAPSDGDNEMSPASRYIAMARQGLLGGDSQETPKRLQDLKDQAKQDGDSGFRTPPLDDALSSPNLRGLSPTTRRRLQAVRRGEMPSDPIRTPTDPFEKNPKTPDSAFGAALRPGAGRMSPEARKRLWKVVSDLPGKPPDPARKSNTPLSEIRNRFLAQFNSESSTPPLDHPVAPRKLHLQDQVDTPPSKIAKRSEEHRAGGASITEDENETTKSSSSASASSSSLPAEVDVQLQRLSAALSGRASTQRSRRVTRDSISVVPVPEPEQQGPESQPNTVGWDDTRPTQAQPCPEEPAAPAMPTTPVPTIKKFMLSSNVDNREEIIEMIQYLGGSVSEGAELDPEATHLLCVAPGRSEKMLGSVAAGRWVLHPAYVARSRANGKFLPEEEFEWGNPAATCLPALPEAERVLGSAAHRWRSARVAGEPGPFAGLTALLHVPAPRRRLLARLITAGDGHAPDDEPPYTNENVTVCFADIKRYPLSDRDAAWLVSKRIPVCAPILLSSFLTEDTPPNLKDHCLPDYRPK